MSVTLRQRFRKNTRRIILTTYLFYVVLQSFMPLRAYGEPPADASPTRYEAEDALLENVAVMRSIHAVDEPVEYSGDGFVGDFNSTDEHLSAVTFEISIPADGSYDLTFYTFSPFSYKVSYVYIDNIRRVGMTIPLAKAFQPIRVSLDLTRGDHLIRVEEAEGFYHLDTLTVALRKRIDIPAVTAPPVNPKASREAVALKSYLNTCYGNVVLSGQHADGMDSPEIKAINAETGKYPAIIEFDFLYTGKTASENLDVVNNTTHNAIDWWRNGGIPAFCWHWLAPKDNLLDSSPWNKTFEARSTAFDLGSVMRGEDPEGYALLLDDIDAVAQELKTLQRANVPVLWRPLHECVSGFFWWGAAGPEASVALWRLMYDRMVNYHGLNNLIWVWSGSTDGCGMLEWYPGDDVVDIVGLDIYGQAKDPLHLADCFLAAQSAVGADKIITLSETGSIPDIDQLDKYGHLWSWFSPWNREYVVDMKAGYEKGLYSEAHTSLETLRETYDHEMVITLDELPSFSSPFSRIWTYVVTYACVILIFYGRSIKRLIFKKRS